MKQICEKLDPSKDIRDQIFDKLKEKVEYDGIETEMSELVKKKIISMFMCIGNLKLEVCYDKENDLFYVEN